MRTRELIEKSIEIQTEGLVDIPREVRESIERVFDDIIEGITKGKAPVNTLEHLDDYVNVIPFKYKAACTQLLITLCYNNDSFEGRIFESLDHATKLCQGICKYIFFLTTQWSSATTNKLSGYIEAVRKNGVMIKFVYITDRGSVIIPV